MEVENFQVSLKHLTMQEEGEEHCQLLWFTVRGALPGHIQTAASSGLWSTKTAEGRTGGVKCVVTLPQSVFPSLQLSAVWRADKTYAACLDLIMLDGKKFTNPLLVAPFSCCLPCS